MQSTINGRESNSLLGLITGLREDVRTLFHEEVQLAKKEVSEKVSHFSRNSIYLAAGGVICYLALQLKFKFNFDDSLDVVAVHFVGGVIGALLLGILADETIGGVAGGMEQFGRQALSVVIAIAYSFIISYALARILDATMGLRVSEDAERRGIDISLHDEQSYVLSE